MTFLAIQDKTIREFLYTLEHNLCGEFTLRLKDNNDGIYDMKIENIENNTIFCVSLSMDILCSFPIGHIVSIAMNDESGIVTITIPSMEHIDFDI